MTRESVRRWLLAELFSQAIHLEQVSEPRATWQVITGLCSTAGSFGISEVSVCSAVWAVASMGVLVVLHCRMLAIDEGDAVVWADLDRLDGLVVDRVQHFLCRSPGAAIGVGWQEGGEQGIHCLRAGVGHLVCMIPFNLNNNFLFGVSFFVSHLTYTYLFVFVVSFFLSLL